MEKYLSIFCSFCVLLSALFLVFSWIRLGRTGLSRIKALEARVSRLHSIIGMSFSTMPVGHQVFLRKMLEKDKKEGFDGFDEKEMQKILEESTHELYSNQKRTLLQRIKQTNDEGMKEHLKTILKNVEETYTLLSTVDHESSPQQKELVMKNILGGLIKMERDLYGE